MKNILGNSIKHQLQLARIKIALELSELKGDSIFLIAIRKGLKRLPLTKVLEMITDQYQDNPALVSSIIGWNLMQRILKVTEQDAKS